MRPSRRRAVREYLSLAAFVLVLCAARSSLADHYWVPTGSMEPTVAVGDHLLVDKLAYGLRLPFTSVWLGQFDGPARGDVVVLVSPADGEILLKRVAALPGDLVSVQGGRLVVNGEEMTVSELGGRLAEDLDGTVHPVQLSRGGGPLLPTVRVPAERYLVLGDNRGESFDGRSFGWVARDQIRGRAEAIVFRHGLTWQPL
jgi:signal peptidase I